MVAKSALTPTARRARIAGKHVRGIGGTFKWEIVVEGEPQYVAFRLRIRRLWRRALHEWLLVPFVLLALVTAAIVTPRGDFPLNDDWSKAEPVKTLIQQHRLEPHFHATATTVAQVLWGALFAWPFGYSYPVLRVSTLVLAVVGAWAVSRWAVEYGLSRRAALLCGTLVFANPIYLNLSYTFMTDVPYFAVIAVSGFFFLRALRTQDPWTVFAGSMFAALACLIRQHGAAMALAFAATVATLWYRDKTRPSARDMLAFTVPWALVGAIAVLWLSRLGVNEEQRSWLAAVLARSPLERVLRILRYAFVVLAYMGLFLLPITCGRACQVITGVERWPRARWKWFAGFTLAAFLVTSALTGLYSVAFVRDMLGDLIRVRSSPGPGWYRMPFLPNVLRDLGTGPLTLTDSYLSAWAPVAIGGWWWVITALSLLSAAVLFTDALSLVRSLVPKLSGTEPWARRSAQDVFLLWWAGISVAFWMLLLTRGTFDRYLLTPLVPFAVLCVSRLQPCWGALQRVAMFVPLAAMYLFSLAGVQDYLAWNQARWGGARWLINERHAAPEQIDGGYEYNAVHTLRKYVEIHKTDQRRVDDLPGWWVLDNTFAISFRPREGYVEVGRVPYFSWLGMRTRRVLLLRKDGAE
jgi:hypothetical protein